jgi:hypothetical protein
MTSIVPATGRRARPRARWRQGLLATTAALSLGVQDAAWARCTDGSTVPATGFTIGLPPLPIAANWSPNVFTGTAGSLFIPDNSVYEHNNPKEPKTGGGHNWVFDQGSTLCKETDVGPAGKLATGWQIPPNTPTQRTRCSPVPPVSADGQFAIATSMKRLQAVYACFNPLGDPGDPSTPINPNFFVPPGEIVKCMQVGQNNMPANLTTAFGPDYQPYFGGRRVVMNFDSEPGGPFTSAWPNCIWEGSGASSLADAFSEPLFFSNGCANAEPNFGFTSALITQPNAMISHGQYMYTAPIGGTIVQFYVTQDPISHISQYQFRTLVTGLSIVTGLGIAEDQKSLMIYADPTAIGLSGQEVVTKMPLCEDMGPTPPPVVVAGNPNPPPVVTPPNTNTPPPKKAPHPRHARLSPLPPARHVGKAPVVVASGINIRGAAGLQQHNGNGRGG